MVLIVKDTAVARFKALASRMRWHFKYAMATVEQLWRNSQAAGVWEGDVDDIIFWCEESEAEPELQARLIEALQHKRVGFIRLNPETGLYWICGNKDEILSTENRQEINRQNALLGWKKRKERNAELLRGVNDGPADDGAGCDSHGDSDASGNAAGQCDSHTDAHASPHAPRMPKPSVPKPSQAKPSKTSHNTPLNPPDERGASTDGEGTVPSVDERRQAAAAEKRRRRRAKDQASRHATAAIGARRNNLEAPDALAMIGRDGMALVTFKYGSWEGFASAYARATVEKRSGGSDATTFEAQLKESFRALLLDAPPDYQPGEIGA